MALLFFHSEHNLLCIIVVEINHLFIVKLHCTPPQTFQTEKLFTYEIFTHEISLSFIEPKAM